MPRGRGYRRRGRSGFKSGFRRGKRAARREMAKFMPMMQRVGIRK